MSTENPATTVAQALQGVQAWRAEEDARRLGELGEVAQEIKSLEAAMENLRQQLEALGTFQGELEAKAADLEAVADQRTYQAIFEVMKVQAAALEQREAEGLAASKAHRSSVPELLAKQGLSGVLEEYEQFKSAVEPTLKHVPESYRAALLEVHRKQEARLREALASFAAASMDAKPLTVDLVFAIDAPEGTPELMVVVVPVAGAVQSGWAHREGGLQTIIAARVAQAIYEAAADVGFVAAQALSGGHLGLLAVELELIGADPKLAEALRTRLAAVARAPELSQANVTLAVQEVSMDHLLPPEEDEEAADGE